MCVCGFPHVCVCACVQSCARQHPPFQPLCIHPPLKSLPLSPPALHSASKTIVLEIIHPLLEFPRSFPPRALHSAGKTIVSEILAIRRLATTNKPFLLVLPTVVLCQQKVGPGSASPGRHRCLQNPPAVAPLCSLLPAAPCKQTRGRGALATFLFANKGNTHACVPLTPCPCRRCGGHPGCFACHQSIAAGSPRARVCILPHHALLQALVLEKLLPPLGKSVERHFGEMKSRGALIDDTTGEGGACPQGAARDCGRSVNANVVAPSGQLAARCAHKMAASVPGHTGAGNFDLKSYPPLPSCPPQGHPKSTTALMRQVQLSARSRRPT